MEVTRFDFALAQLRVNPAKVKSFPVSEHPSAARLRSILTNFISRLDLHQHGTIFRHWLRLVTPCIFSDFIDLNSYAPLTIVHRLRISMHLRKI